MRSIALGLAGLGLISSTIAAPQYAPYDPSPVSFRRTTDPTKKGIFLMNRIAPSNTVLYIANPDGSNERSLLGNNSHFDYHATVSNDGQWVVFTSERNGDGNSDLYRVRVDGSDLELIAGSPSVEDQGALSPDGKLVAYVSTANGYKSNIWVTSLENGTSWNVTNTPDTVGWSWSPQGHFRPAWSPDSQWIAFSSDRNTEWLGHDNGTGWEHTQANGIYLIRPDGSDFTTLIKEDGLNFGSPKFSADGSRITYYNMTRQQTWDAHRPEDLSTTYNQIYSVDVATGTDVVQETFDDSCKIQPSYLSDGSIGYVIKAGDAEGIGYTSESTTHSAFNGTYLRSPSWPANSSFIVYEKSVFEPVRPMDMPLYSWQEDWEYRFTDVFPQLNQFGKMAMTQKQLGNSSIVTLNPNGTDLELTFDVYATDQVAAALVNQGLSGAFQPNWSPDAEWITFGLGAWFTMRSVYNAQIYRVTANGSYFEELTDDDTNSGFPSYSHDGTAIVYRVFGDDLGLRLLNLTTGATTNLTWEWDNLPEFSPDGSKILFTRRVNATNYDVLTMDPDGTNVAILTESGANDAHAVWTHDGRIAYNSGEYGFREECAIYDQTFQPYGQVMIMDADGSNKQMLTDSIWEDSMPLYVPNEFL